MANSFFRFKKFTVNQGNCAMKVCTDACIFGAWTAEKMTAIPGIRNILDIGAGTGLLSLMLAQTMPQEATIDAVEIDEGAARQTRANFAYTPWKQQLSVYNTPIQQYQPPAGTTYDLIVTNPPFFENDLPSASTKRNLALHSAALTLKELLEAVNPLLKPTGHLAILLPYHRARNFIAEAEKQRLFLNQATAIRQTFLHSQFRSMLLFSRTPAVTPPSLSQSIVIKDAAGNYSEAFRKLLTPYYLYL
ncbi:tRNA1(Val) (adenine(37)-N6)-methyltransferase [Filimonas effusa]|uniref:tRNA1(Val) (adenine(37)-N6)-methyltransferase n=1 Tax=Filimonas effusa TaxID=2508721 RepID=A0A4Q1DCT5_9BACT|nr:methyltransferase [Filimonas effusa]RXK87287.1 methyltransferase domain-containing protein [Filimonas effusa]